MNSDTVQLVSQLLLPTWYTNTFIFSCNFSDVSEITGAPEMLGGRVKTLHPKVHGGRCPLLSFKQIMYK